LNDLNGFDKCSVRPVALLVHWIGKKQPKVGQQLNRIFWVADKCYQARSVGGVGFTILSSLDINISRMANNFKRLSAILFSVVFFAMIGGGR
jgi:hypothetical protein